MDIFAIGAKIPNLFFSDLKEFITKFEQIHKSLISNKINNINELNDNGPILFFDGVCNLCNWSVDIVLRLEKNKKIRFAPLQSRYAALLFEEYGNLKSLDSIIFRMNGKNYVESDAVIEISKYFKSPFSYFKYLHWIPRVFRNSVYRLIARNRYNFFGKRSSCRIPTSDLASRFFS
jgi:predicted DCC family thiol-disulfide oxidoreductase YuxK